MIKIEDILNATRGGLDIILDIYPQAADCVGNKKHFAIRDERTPSASLRLYDSEKYGRIWQVTDFGGEGRGENGVSVYMRENRMDRSQFHEALLQLAAQYGVKDELNHNVNKPTIEQRDAKPEEKDGERYFELNGKFTDYELKIMGPNVTQEHVEALHWYSVKWITNTKNRKTTVKSSNDHYPIFMRECIITPGTADAPAEKFYKIYEPLNCDKGFRFSYTPAGKKPQHYINGLAELKEAYRVYNANEEAALHKSDPDAPYKPKRLQEAIICSGERDSLCCRSLGFYPLWFNSETYSLSVEEYKEIMKYVEVLYNIPDLDETGKRKGKELALKFIDIRTIWLPERLSDFKDHRGKPRKDLRDWMEIWPDKKAFKNLMKVAMPTKFWITTKNDKGKSRHEIDTACLFNFLELNGFYILHNDDSDIPQFIRVQGNIVKKITTKTIREFVIKWLRERYEDRDVINLALTSMRLTNSALESLSDLELDFTSYTSRSQLFFFEDQTIEVGRIGEISEDGWKTYKPGADNLHNYVWDENVIKHPFKRLPKMFEIKKTEDQEMPFDITITDNRSNFFKYLINSSRLYWRNELEIRFEGYPAAAQEYAANNKFRIDGEGLQLEEIRDQKMNLISKIFSLGYMLHHYKTVSRAWAPMAMDSKIGTEGECNGRSGKSFFFSALSLVMNTVKLSGRNPKLMDNPHVFDQVSQHTDLMLVDDCSKDLNMGLFYDNITSDMTVNPKNNRSFTIPFKDSPKLAFTTNYIPSEFSPSTEARSLYLVFSDYYHQKTDTNDYLETRSIRDDFHKDLYGSEYKDEEWNADLNFFIQCCHFYLQYCDSGVKPQPPMRNIMVRKMKYEMGENFEEWANGYFSQESDHLDELLQREVVFMDYKVYANVQRITMQSFNRKLKAFCTLCPWVAELNPKELADSSGRIQRRVNTGTGTTAIKDMIYLKSVPKPAEDPLVDGGNDLFSPVEPL